MQESDYSSTTSSDTESFSSTTSPDTDSVSSETSSSLDSSPTSSSDSDSSADPIVNLSQQPPSAVKTPQSNVEQPKKDAGMMHPDPSIKPPGHGRRTTQTRNQRRRFQRMGQKLKRAGILPLDATRDDVRRVIGDNHTPEHSRSSVSMELSQRVQSTTPSTLEVKRQALLESITSNDVKIRSEDIKDGATDIMFSNIQESATTTTSEPKRFSPRLDSDESSSTDMHDTLLNVVSVTVPPEPIADSSSNLVTSNILPQNHEANERPTSEPAKRRTKLDLASSRRLLFGSLGYRAPKTKADEESLRERLMQNIRSIPQAKDKSTGTMLSDTIEANSDDNWRDRIVLKAVECCHEGIDLSAPPFPFIQRWDPQQQRSQSSHKRNTNGGGKKRKRNQGLYLEKESNQDDCQGSSKHQEPSICEDIVLCEDTQPDEHDISRIMSQDYQVAIDEQILRDTNTTSVDGTDEVSQKDELPSLPADISMIPDLLHDTATKGAIIAYKQLEMSETTNWQPQVSKYRTAMIDKILEDGKFEMTLAQRDRPQKYKCYDDETGERIYSNFEMPQDDDDDDRNMESDTGFVELALEEMIEPKLIKAVEFEKHLPLNQDSKDSMDNNELSTIQDAVMVSSTVNRLENKENMKVFKCSSPELVDDSLPKLDAYSIVHQQQRTEPLGVAEDTRKEISILIKDAGFRSDVHSGIDRGLENDNQDNIHLDIHRSFSQDSLHPDISPKLNSLSSSPPADQGSGLELDVTEPTNKSISLLGSDNFELPETQFPCETSILDESGGHRHPIRRGSQDLFPTSDEDSKRFHVDSSPPSHLVQSSPKEWTLLNKSVSPPPTAAQGLAHAGKADTVPLKTEFGMFDGAQSDSSGDFPSVEKIFSTQNSICASRSQGDKLSQRPRRSFTTKNGSSDSQPKSWSQPEPRVRPNSRSLATDAITILSAESNNESSNLETMSGPSRIPFGSQIVDLTISSDPVEPEDSEFEERSIQSLPSGPGWVKKIKTEKSS